MAQPEWLSASETKLALERAGLKDGELVRILSWACSSRRLVVTGFRQIDHDDDFAVADNREQFQQSHVWRFFHRAFADGSGIFGEDSTFNQVDWDGGSFSYRIERDGDDTRAAMDVECRIDWARGEASYAYLSESNHLRDNWRGIMFDAPLVGALTRSIRDRPKKSRGRPPTYNWAAFELEAKRLIWDEGGFNEIFRQADCERSMADWCSINWERTPAESNIRDHVQNSYRTFEAEKSTS
jgi:hypothetical protein